MHIPTTLSVSRWPRFNVCVLEGLVGEVPWTSYENDINDRNASTARFRQAVFPEPLP